MKHASIRLVAVGLLALACEGPTATAPGIAGPLASMNGLGVVHRASVGSSDITPPGVDPNFSLIAIERADGSVTGQWHDQFAGGVGVHVAVNCLHVAGNQAWVSGVATDPTFEGQPVITRVADNGTSANDPADRISFSFIGVALSCHATPNLPLFPISNGEVKVH